MSQAALRTVGDSAPLACAGRSSEEPHPPRSHRIGCDPLAMSRPRAQGPSPAPSPQNSTQPLRQVRVPCPFKANVSASMPARQRSRRQTSVHRTCMARLRLEPGEYFILYEMDGLTPGHWEPTLARG